MKPSSSELVFATHHFLATTLQGKTLQTIATILDNRPILQHSKPGAKHPPSIKGDELEKRIAESQLWDQASVDWRHELKMNDVKPKMTPKNPVRAGTLVVCPVIALSQWKTEIEKFTEEDTLSIVIYHGPDRKKEHPVQKLCKYDIVLTTYQCIEQDFRKMVSPNKVTCPNCGGKFKIDKLRIHLKYFCGEGAQKTEAQARQERHRNGRGGPSGRGSGSSQGKGKDGGKKKEFPTTTVAKKAKGPSKQKTEKSAKKPAAMPKRKGKKAPGKKGKSKVMDNDSSSESEEETNEMISTPAPAQRPSRSAAVAASKRVASSVNEWSASKDVSYSVEDEESFGAESSSESDDDDESVMSYNEEDSDGEVIPSKKAPKNPAPKKSSRKRAPLPESSDDSDGSDDESDDAVLARARKKQAAAFKQAKNGKTTSKKPPLKGKVKKGKKKFDDESSSEEESDDDKVPSGDPLDDIDLDKLLSEAMEGSQMSTLHSMCWWRVVLDEVSLKQGHPLAYVRF